MFWGSFLYNKKGLCHIWKTETAKEKKEADTELEALNISLEPAAKKAWELDMWMSQLNLQQKPAGQTPQWCFTAKRGKVVQQGKEGIDWYQYSKIILHQKLLPFTQECQKDQPKIIVQEDRATPHVSLHNLTLFGEYSLERLDWPGNSPDLNAIKPCWPWMKWVTTKSSPLKCRGLAEEA